MFFGSHIFRIKLSILTQCCCFIILRIYCSVICGLLCIIMVIYLTGGGALCFHRGDIYCVIDMFTNCLQQKAMNSYTAVQQSGLQFDDEVPKTRSDAAPAKIILRV